MRVVICDYSGHPFQVELSRCLAARGHETLHLHFAEFQAPKGSLVPRSDDPPTFHVEGISIDERFAKENFVIPNWAPLSEISPVPKDNPWARGHGLHAKTVALYSGTLGLKHDPGFLVHLARTGNASGIQVVVVSEGPAVEWLRQQKAVENLHNLVLLPFQPMSEYPQALGTADIVLSMIGEEAAAFSVPSKVLSYLAAGKPIVASIAEANDAAQIITGAFCGRVVRPGDAEAFTGSVMALAAEPGLRMQMGENAHRYAEHNFDIGRITDRFEAIFLGRGEMESALSA